MRSIVTVLQEARELILKEEHWTTEYLARDAEGRSALPSNPDACQWCALGALIKVGNGLDYEQFLRARRLLPMDVTSLNDTLSHEDVIQMFDDAIAKAKGQA